MRGTASIIAIATSHYESYTKASSVYSYHAGIHIAHRLGRISKPSFFKARGGYTTKTEGVECLRRGLSIDASLGVRFFPIVGKFIFETCPRECAIILRVTGQISSLHDPSITPSSQGWRSRKNFRSSQLTCFLFPESTRDRQMLDIRNFSSNQKHSKHLAAECTYLWNYCYYCCCY